MASTIKSNTVTNSTGSTLTLGESGTTVTLACGATQSGFGRTGTVDWCTTAKTSTFTAVSGKGYFVNTCGGAITVNLPAGTAGDIIGLKDYAGTWATACKAITIAPNGSEKIGGGNDSDPSISTEGASLLLVYVDGTQGWLSTDYSVTPSPSGTENFICASGGTPSQFGDYEIRTFTGSGTFQVNSLATAPANDIIDYVVVAGGGGGGSGTSGGSGGGGAGGYRSFTCQPVTVATYPVTIGGGGVGAPPGANPVPKGTSGSTSTFRCNSSAGGGGGGSQDSAPGIDGGSGGGGGYNSGSGGSGNTAPVSPPQGNNGGAEANPGCNGGGGGGATTVGASNTGTDVSPGGSGADISPLYGTGVGVSGLVAGGGGGGGYNAIGVSPGGPGGGGNGEGGGSPTSPTSGNATATDGTANTGGGGGAAASQVGGSIGPSFTIGAGGSGVVIIRYKRQ